MDVDGTELTIGQAAAALGLSENALRLRLNRGQIVTPDYTAFKGERGRWRVVVRDQSTPGSTDSGHSRDTVGTQSPVVTAAQLQQIELIRDQWIAPYVARLEERAEEVGRLSAELVAARAEVDRLRAEVDAARAAPAPSSASTTSPSTSTSWWRRIGRGSTQG